MPSYLSRPADIEDVRKGRARHNDCEGRIYRPASYYESRACDKCERSWNEDVLERFTPQDIAERFHVEVAPNWSTEVLVWVPDPVTGRRYAKAVPLWEAEGKERVWT
jgi:hypothetical protein